MALVADIGMAQTQVGLESRLTSGVTASFGPQGTRHHGFMAVLCATHSGEEDLDLAVQTAEEIRTAHITSPEYLSSDKVILADLTGANRSVRVHLSQRPLLSVDVLHLNQRNWSLGHLGGNRIWLFRDSRLQQLTSDHLLPSVSGPPKLVKACGMHSKVDCDLANGELQVNDVFLMTTPNVNEVLSGSVLMSCLIEDWPAQKMADEVRLRAETAGLTGEMTATVIRVLKLPSPQDAIGSTSALPRPRPLPKDEEDIDRFLIERRLRKGRLSNLYKARDTLNDAEVMIKFPNPEALKVRGMIEGFIQDEWLGKRQASALFLPGYPIARGRRSSLYTVTEYRNGENLARRVKRKNHLSTSEVLLIGSQLLHALETMHQDRIHHLDIRPENIVLDKHNQEIFLLGIDQHRIRLLLKAGADEALKILNPCYLPPETFTSNTPGQHIDIYATGVTLFRLATGKHPYGNLTRPEEALKKKMRTIERYQQDFHPVLAQAIAQACSAQPANRFQTIKQFAETLGDIRTDKKGGRSTFLRRNKGRRKSG